MTADKRLRSRGHRDLTINKSINDILQLGFLHICSFVNKSEVKRASGSDQCLCLHDFEKLFGFFVLVFRGPPVETNGLATSTASRKLP